MNYYQELTLIRQMDVDRYFIWSKLYTQLHLALVKMKDSEEKVSIGISFPEYFYNDQDQNGFLGSKLRIFAESEDVLKQLDLAKCLERLNDYIHLSEIKPVPEKIKGHAIYQRQRSKSNIERLARRKARRQGIKPEEALMLLGNFKEEKLNVPFVNVQSWSTREKDSDPPRKFKLFIAKKMMAQPVFGKFCLYGLSSSATVPEF